MSLGSSALASNSNRRGDFINFLLSLYSLESRDLGVCTAKLALRLDYRINAIRLVGLALGSCKHLFVFDL